MAQPIISSVAWNEGWLGCNNTPPLQADAGYTLIDVDIHATGATPRYQQVNLMLDYLLSKRTDVYAMAACLSGSGGIEQQSPVFDPNRDAAQVLNPARVDVIKNGLKF
jgi:predicted porin